MGESSMCDNSTLSKNVGWCKFVLKVVVRLHDGCSVMFTVHRHFGTDVFCERGIYHANSR